MKKSTNKSYNRIIDYLNLNKDISYEDKKLLVSYATQLVEKNLENKKDEKIDDIIKDVYVLDEYLSSSDTTSLVMERRIQEKKIIEMIIKYLQTKEIDIEDISYELDKLYIKTDLKVRENSSLSYNLEKIIKKGNKEWIESQYKK